MMLRSISSQSVEDLIKTVTQIPTINLALRKNHLESANKELVEIARSNPSVLRKRSYRGMCEENWTAEVKHELSTDPMSCGYRHAVDPT